ncbi:MAG: adenylate/guanylate cyclase domain-containing protein [Bradyrhizobium sp.]|uniref:adenylate/guanylate cyclase domain-containing protein n=1 Tax=Bradyrhizobium sp. TaxID=376 RepID=UPI001D5920BB|nr:adenylate/guanylate cyclase domain-containing protein [Bradyrhizobium sp.]MBV9564320.1 adenylate/guanylate cyclase domain-containing protein [Bradyrhizobium sp.]
MAAITKFWRDILGPREDVSKDFAHLLMREVMRTELVRVRALIVVALVIMLGISLVHALFPEVTQRVWKGINPNLVQLVLAGFIAFEMFVHRTISHHLKLDRDLPFYRRYVGVLIETSVPTLLLSLQIESMGPVRALGFVMPLVYFIFIILSTLRLDFWLSAFTGLVAATELFAMAMHYRPVVNPDPEPELYYHLSRSFVVFSCGLLAGAVGVQLRRGFAASIRAATARDRLTNLFGQHVSPQVVERLLLEGAGTQSDIRQVAVMFVDFRSFTASARSRSPQDVVDRLDGAFAVLVEILDRHGGIVNKFLGDGFLALFGAPFEAEDPAHRAVGAAREMLAAMARINEGSTWPLRIGIGIHFGEVVAGNIGSPRRKEYTVIGDTVNFASRLEALNKEFGSHLLISSAVHEALGENVADAVSLGDVPVRGYDHPVRVWQLG